MNSITIREAATQLGISISFARRLVASGQLPVEVLAVPGRRPSYRVPQAGLDEYRERVTRPAVWQQQQQRGR